MYALKNVPLFLLKYVLKLSRSNRSYAFLAQHRVLCFFYYKKQEVNIMKHIMVDNTKTKTEVYLKSTTNEFTKLNKSQCCDFN